MSPSITFHFLLEPWVSWSSMSCHARRSCTSHSNCPPKHTFLRQTMTRRLPAGSSPPPPWPRALASSSTTCRRTASSWPIPCTSPSPEPSRITWVSSPSPPGRISGVPGGAEGSIPFFEAFGGSLAVTCFWSVACSVRLDPCWISVGVNLYFKYMNA